MSVLCLRLCLCLCLCICVYAILDLRVCVHLLYLNQLRIGNGIVEVLPRELVDPLVHREGELDVTGLGVLEGRRHAAVGTRFDGFGVCAGTHQ